MKRKGIIAATAVLCMSVSAFAANKSITVHNTAEGLYLSVGSERVDLGGAKMFIDEHNRAQVPLRVVAENLGAKVDWDEKTQTVTITRDDTVLRLTIGSDILYRNGDPVTMDTAAMIVDDLTYIPVGYVGLGFGCPIAYTVSDTPFMAETEIYDGIPQEIINHRNG